ncbi:MAG: hypothetical protein GY906_39135 [bacterium]|nr:hypothetical protein [bacterium]
MKTRHIVSLIVCVPILTLACSPVNQGAKPPPRPADDYEWFENRHQAIKAYDAEIKSADAAVSVFGALSGPRYTWTPNDCLAHNRLAAVALDLHQQRNDAVAEYNARSRTADRDISRTSDLPVTINRDE